MAGSPVTQERLFPEPAFSTPALLSPFPTDAPMHDSDLLILGSGIAGLTAALKAAEHMDVAVLSKGELSDGASGVAQGGIAVALRSPDSPDLHFRDTLAVGGGLCDAEAVRLLVEEGPQRVEDLIALGMSFDAKDGGMALAREGGHSLPRVVHVGDATGSAVQGALVRAVRSHARIHLWERAFCQDLVIDGGACRGVLAYFDGRPHVFRAPATLLATGGAGHLFEVTTNPPTCTGDGLAMAFRAGARLLDMEFVQFHPTVLYSDAHPRFLLTEALRGDGAVLLNASGRRFMLDYHPLADLAPRDVVVRALAETMAQEGSDRVFLDARMLPAEAWEKGYPTIFERCCQEGIDPRREPIPTTFAAHYTLGGVEITLDGATAIPGLYASGEVANAGVHGANRLASNSLLEGLVFSDRVVRRLVREGTPARVAGTTVPCSGATRSSGPNRIEVSEIRDELGRLMMEHAGVVRSGKGLEHGLEKLKRWESVLSSDFGSPEGWELQNVLTVAQLVIGRAFAREESRGVHFRNDYPEPREIWARRRVIWQRGQ